MSGYLDPVGEGRQINLDKAVVFFGRGADCDVVLTRSRKVSRKHCCIAQVGDRYVLRDLGSMNGVRVNGARVKIEARIKYGDEIAIGDVLYVLRSETDAPESNGKGVKVRPATVRQMKAGPKAPPIPPPMPSEEFAVILPEPEEMSLDPETPRSMPRAVDADPEPEDADEIQLKENED